jgi:hypothetical protein
MRATFRATCGALRAKPDGIDLHLYVPETDLGQAIKVLAMRKTPPVLRLLVEGAEQEGTPGLTSQAYVRSLSVPQAGVSHLVIRLPNTVPPESLFGIARKQVRLDFWSTWLEYGDEPPA